GASPVVVSFRRAGRQPAVPRVRRRLRSGDAVDAQERLRGARVFRRPDERPVPQSGRRRAALREQPVDAAALGRRARGWSGGVRLAETGRDVAARRRADAVSHLGLLAAIGVIARRYRGVAPELAARTACDRLDLAAAQARCFLEPALGALDQLL